MEYKGMRIVQSKNGNVVINASDGSMFIITNPSNKYLNDDELKKIAEKQLRYLKKE